MNFLVFDSETTGLPKHFNSLMTDLDNWPRLTQLAYMLIDEKGNELDSFCELIKPENWTIPKEQFFIDNNMSTERCEKEGILLQDALRCFQDSLKRCKYKVAHNISFDRNILGAELIRKNFTIELFKYKPEICTMKKTANHVKIKTHAGRNKWPKLSELHNHLFGYDFEGAHDALEDVKATSKCLIESINRGYIKLR